MYCVSNKHAINKEALSLLTYVLVISGKSMVDTRRQDEKVILA